MRSIVGLGLCAALAACTSLGTADKDVAPPSAEETLYVLGVSPATSRVRVSAGEVAYGLFKPDAWAVLARVYANPTGGYLVWKGPASETSAVTLVRFVKERNDILGADFVPCGETRTLVFRPREPGKAVYLGDMSFGRQGNRLLVRHGEDVAAARAFVQRDYPQLKGEVVQGRLDFMPTSQSCSGTTRMVPVYVPQRSAPK